MTPISDYVILPKTKNEVLFFHGIKSQEHYDSISQNYNRSTIDCEEIVIQYTGQNLLFEKNSFLSTKTLPDKVDFKIYDQNNELVFSLNDQLINYYFLFYINNLFLPSGNYNIKILNSSDGTCIFRDVLKVS